MHQEQQTVTQDNTTQHINRGDHIWVATFRRVSSSKSDQYLYLMTDILRRLPTAVLGYEKQPALVH